MLQITIDGDTAISFTEDVIKRYVRVPLPRWNAAPVLDGWIYVSTRFFRRTTKTSSDSTQGAASASWFCVFRFLVHRFEAYGWHTQVVADGTNTAAIAEAIENAKLETGKPSIIKTKTIIGHGSQRQVRA